jgi:carboxylesterase type B
MGQSSGGTNVLALLASPRSKGLFQGAITLSASPNITMDAGAASALHSRYLMPLLGCVGANATRQCLLQVRAAMKYPRLFDDVALNR